MAHKSRCLQSIFILLVIVIPLTYIIPIESYNANNQSDMRNPVEQSIPSQVLDPNHTKFTANHFPDGSFEEWWNPRYPSFLQMGSQSGEKYTWYATTPWPASGGLRSGGIQARAQDQWVPSSARWMRVDMDIDPRNLTIMLDWWLDENPDPSSDGDLFYIELEFNDYSEIYYYLNGTSEALNSSLYHSAYFHLDEPSNAWNRFERNVTADYLSVPELGGVVDGGLKLEDISFWVASSGTTNKYIRAFIDNVSIVNGTTIYIGNTTENGNFESDASWNRSGNSDISYIGQSPVSKFGTWSLNMTTSSKGNGSNCWLYDYTNIRITRQNPSIFSLWFNINDWQRASNNSFAYIYFEAGFYRIWYYLCYGGETPPDGSMAPPPSNGTRTLVLHPRNFNVTGSWVQINQSILDDAADYFSVDEIGIFDVWLYSRNYEKDGRLSILFDQFEITSAALNDMGYEDQGSLESPILGWTGGWASSGWYNQTDFTVTDETYSGLNAANLTLMDYHLAGQTFSRTQYLGAMPLSESRQLYLNFAYKLKEISGVLAYVSFTFTLRDGRSMLYYMRTSGGSGLINDTYDVCFNLRQQEIAGEWNLVNRDFAHDYEAAFGVIPNTFVKTVVITAGTATGERIELLLDDVYLFDDSGPVISDVTHYPELPAPNDLVEVSAEIHDADIDTVLLHYNVGSGTWNNLSMSVQVDYVYSATIPAQVYMSQVEYYLTANDTFGLSTTSLTFLYIVSDTQGPSVEISNPSDNSDVSGVVDIIVDANDSVSGIAYVEIWIEASLVLNETTGPFLFSWQTDWVSLDTFDILAVAFDNVGLSSSDSISVRVVDTTPPILDSPNNQTFVEGETGYFIMWTPSDLRPAIYEIFMDGSSIRTGFWNSSEETITIYLENLDFGLYNFTLLVIDEGGNFAIDQVFVEVLEVTPPETTTTDETTSPTTSIPTTSDQTQTTFIIIIGGIGVAAILVVVVFLVHNKGKNRLD